MAMRVLTTKFLSYPVSKWEKANDKGVLDLLDVGKLELNKMAQVIKLGITKGSKETDEEHWMKAYERIDNYLAQEDKGLVDLFLQVLREYDMDYKILKTSGMNIDDLEKELKAEMGKSLNKTKDTVAESVKDDEEVVETAQPELTVLK